MGCEYVVYYNNLFTLTASETAQEAAYHEQPIRVWAGCIGTCRVMTKKTKGTKNQRPAAIGAGYGNRLQQLPVAWKGLPGGSKGQKDINSYDRGTVNEESAMRARSLHIIYRQLRRKGCARLNMINLMFNQSSFLNTEFRELISDFSILYHSKLEQIMKDKT